MKQSDESSVERFGRRVREEREKKKLSQAVVAEKADLDPGDLSKIENGKGPASIGLERADRIAAALGVSTADLLSS